MSYAISIKQREKPEALNKGITMKTQVFATAEEYIIGQKYNVLNRKARKIQDLVTNGWTMLISGPGLFVLTKEEGSTSFTTAVSGSMFFPTVDSKMEPIRTATL